SCLYSLGVTVLTLLYLRRGSTLRNCIALVIFFEKFRFRIWSLGATCRIAISARVVVVGSGLLLACLLFTGAHPFLWCK
ncbi:hypothetical protein S245_051122, partial [Arachis hypogaea]